MYSESLACIKLDVHMNISIPFHTIVLLVPKKNEREAKPVATDVIMFFSDWLLSNCDSVCYQHHATCYQQQYISKTRL